MRLLISGIAISLVVAACGSSGSKKASTTQPTVTSEESTTTLPSAALTEVSPAATTPSTVVGSSPTTAKKTTVTTVKRSIAPAAGSNASTGKVQAGVTNVTSAPTTAARSDIVPGGSLTVYKPAEVAGLDPLVILNAGNLDAAAAFMLYDPLFYSQNGAVVPQSAESLTSQDGLVWTLKLHANMKFSDGTDWNAAAVKFNWERMADPANKATRAAAAQLIQSMDVVDATTLKITLKAKNALFPGSATLIPFIGSPTAIQQEGNDKFNSNPVGGGPFTLKSWVRDSQLTLARNPNYWNQPRPYLDQVVIKVVTDESQRLNTFCGGPSGSLAFFTAVGSASTLQNQNCGKLEPFGLNGGTNMFYNTTKAPMSNLKLRQGIAKAINFDDYSKVVNSGLIPPTHSVFRPDSPFYDPNLLQPAFDPTGAQALFDQASAELGTDVINIPLETLDPTSYQTSAQYIQGALNKYKHINVTYTALSPATHLSNCNQRQFAGICHFAVFFDDPDPVWVNYFLCNSPVNPSGWCNADFDRLVQDNRTTLDPKQRIQDIKDAEKLIYNEQPSLWVEYRYSWNAHATNLQDLGMVNDGAILFDRLWFKR